MWGNCDKVLIRSSVNPSLRNSLLLSEVALTNGSTAIESMFFPGAPRHRYAPTAAAITRIAATAPIQYLRLDRGAGTITAVVARPVAGTVRDSPLVSVPATDAL